MSNELARDLYRQARDRAEEFETGQPSNSPATPTPGNDEDEDRLEPPGGAQVHEAARLRHSAEMAERAHRLAEAEELNDGE